MDNHIHLLLRIEPETASGWSPEEVARRWLTLYPPRVNRQKVAATATDSERLAATREPLRRVSSRLGTTRLVSTT